MAQAICQFKRDSMEIGGNGGLLLYRGIVATIVRWPC
jgi:hypothetical protein